MKRSSSNNSMIIKRQSKTVSTECKICGAPATYSFFGVISCHSCKMFFKRNAEQKQKALKCKYDTHCEIDMINRRMCSSCRLDKCFTNGMRIEMFRSSQSKMNKRNRIRKIMTNSTELILTPVMKLNAFPTLNILKTDPSTLNVDQWNLLSNLVDCYDEYDGLILAEQFLCQQNALPLKLRFRSSPVREFITSLISEPQLSFRKNPDFLSLCSHDRSTLLHYSTKYNTILNASFIGRQARLLDHSGFLQSTENLFGPTRMTIIKRLIDQLDFDLTFIKLVFSILSFSTTNYTIYTNTDAMNLVNTKAIIHIHDTYIELAWRYLLYKYDYHQTVTYFSKFVSCLFTLNAILVEVHEEKFFTYTIDSIVEHAKQTLPYND